MGSTKPSILIVAGLLLAATNLEAAWPPSKCTHVRVLAAGDDDEIVEYNDARLENAGPRQLDVLGEALDMMPDVLCQSVRRVAFLYRPPEDEDKPAIDAWTNRNEHQDLVYLNTYNYLAWNEDIVDRSPGLRAAAIQRMIHESTHAAIRLIQSQQKAEPYRFRQERADENLWPANARQLAKSVVKSNRLNSGVIREWERLHLAFVSAGMSEEYYDDDWTEKVGYSVEYLAKAGFMSPYGGEQAIEDIAEMTSWATVRGTPDEPEDGACQVMSGRAGPSINRDDAAVFTKLNFVRTLGFISEQHYKACVGSLHIEAPGPGFFSYKSGNLARSYTVNPNAGAGRGSGDDEQWLIANITAEGSVTTSSEEVPVTVTLMLNVTPLVDAITDPGKRADRLAILPADVSYPRGVYHVGFRHSKLNRLQMARQSDGALIMDVGQGVALVSRASSDGIEGSVAIQRVFNYSGGLLSAIAGDEPVKHPTKITFRHEPGSS